MDQLRDHFGPKSFRRYVPFHHSFKQRGGTTLSQVRIGLTVYLETRVHWPAYDAEQPEIVFFDINHKDLLYVDSDIYRAEGIKFISDHLASDFGR